MSILVQSSPRIIFISFIPLFPPPPFFFVYVGTLLTLINFLACSSYSHEAGHDEASGALAKEESLRDRRTSC